MSATHQRPEHSSNADLRLIEHMIKEPCLKATLHAAHRNNATFGWEDGSTAPTLSPSNAGALNLPGYSHWGFDGLTTLAEPNNALSANEQCGETRRPDRSTNVDPQSQWFSYGAYTGASGDYASPDRQLPASYDTSGSLVRMWNDANCGNSANFLCEVTGEAQQLLPAVLATCKGQAADLALLPCNSGAYNTISRSSQPSNICGGMHRLAKPAC